MSRFFYLPILFGLAACSSLEERQRASGGFDYVNDTGHPGLSVPPELDSPQFSKQYAIPAIGENADAQMVGKKVTVISPALVLPLVTGSHVEEGVKQATVYFDQVDDSQALDTTIWNSLINFLSEQGIGVDHFDNNAQQLVTDWMLIEQEDDSSWYSWTKTERSIGRRFEFNLDVKPHGRTAALKVKLRDYLETQGEQVISELSADEVRRNEVDVLNQVIGHYQNQIRVADARRIKKIRTGLDTEMGFNADGEPAYVVSADYQIAWPRLLLVLRTMGFNVKDLDQSTGLMFVEYVGSEEGWWSNLWGDDEALPIEQDDYRLKVATQGVKTAITFMNDESEPFTAKQVSELYQPFVTAMSNDDLDM